MKPGLGGQQQSDIEVIAALFESIAAGDPARALLLIHPDVVWTPTVWSGGATLRGQAAVADWFGQFGSSFDSLRINVNELVAAEDEAVVLATVHDSRESGSMSIRVGWTFVVKDGLVLEGRAYESWDEAMTAAGR